MKFIFNQDEIKKKKFNDRWVRFAFGPQGFENNGDLNLGIVNFSKNRQALNHRHIVDEALFILKGKAKIKVGDNVYTIKKNDFVYVPRNTDHQVITAEESIKILFVFSGDITIGY